MPRLRRLTAPHYRNQSKPFFYKKGEEMVIYNEALLQLICTEAERAIAASNEYL